MFGFHPSRRAARSTRPVTAHRSPIEALESRQLLSGSDLSLREVKSTLPTTAVTGTTIKGTVTVQATNVSGLKVSGPETFTVTGVAADGTTVTLGTLAKKNFPIGVNGTPKVAIPVKTIVSVSDDYSLNVQASGDSSVSLLAGAGSLDVAAAQVSLQATALTVSGKSANFLVNHAVTFKVTLVNNGNINTSAPLSAVLALSTDGLTAISPPLTVTPVKKAVVIKDTGKPVTLTYTVKVDQPGTYHIGGTFSTTDAIGASGDNSVVEFSSTTINVLSSIS